MPEYSPYDINNPNLSEKDREELRAFYRDFVEADTGRPVEQAIMEQDYYTKATRGLGDILSAGGLTPQQRAMLSAAMNRQLGLQAEQAGQASQRRAAAQGISGTGLANAMQGNIFSGLLSAQQQGESALDKYSLDLYQNALQTLFGASEKDKAQRMQAAAQEGGGLGGFLGGAAGLLTGSILGPAGEAIGGKLGSKLGRKIFGED